ncbi:hypothetical protein HKCCE3408_18135 [Rhodobacterales bacterium HKCCE3408]|nr:hypothetical protein [Rhodobacterales bacterium HKCCE3408]
MLNFLFGRKPNGGKVETQRQTFERLVGELNAAIDRLSEKPRITIDPATGHVLPETPEQFPDEALALPRPEAKTEAPAEDAAAGEEEKAAAPSDDREAPQPKVLPGTPVPKPPKPGHSA